MSSMTVTDIQAQAPKFSRYRSVRKAATPTIPEDVPAVPNPNAAEINRAPSRYHRANRQRTQTVPIPTQSNYPSTTTRKLSPRTPTQNDHTTNPNVPVETALPATSKSSPARQNEHEFVGGPVRSQQPAGATTPRHERHLSRQASVTTRSPSNTLPRQSYEAAREEARLILEGEYDRLQKMKDVQKRDQRNCDMDAPDLKRRPTQNQQPKSQPTPAQSQPPPVFFDAPKLNVKRKVERAMPEKFHDAPQPVRQKQQQLSEQQPKLNRIQETKQQTTAKPFVPIDAPVSAAQRHLEAPNFDAPVSAVNAGDRRVEIRLNNAEYGITLPVTPTTNSKDLLNSASVVMSDDFDPKTSILVESFSKLGLERPLRRYEHIRDVMNSWDSDDQNYLSIMTQSECQAIGLERSDAPLDPPANVMLQMHLSLRPGKWDKRWVILRSDGQVTMSKQENDGEGTNICHLSDFDVYTPTLKQRKKLKPPKKICFAIKSQQKSAMFLEGVNFVHFFATNDKHIADQWYSAVQTWRSWYLVHVMCEGVSKPKEVITTNGLISALEVRPMTAQSTDSTPYQLGSFQPLLDFSDLNFDNLEAESKPKGHTSSKKPSVDLGFGRPSLDVSANGPTNRGSRQRGMPPSSFPGRMFGEGETRRQPSLDNSDQAFTGGGLLGRSLSTRRGQGSKTSSQGPTGVGGKPLVDLTPASEFAEGSLLRKLEALSASQGENELKVDRQKRVEADVRVGEGLG